MEEDKEMMKHVCKFCNKSFPSGRSLGGHIRSHMINSDEPEEKKLKKKKLPSIIHGGNSNGHEKIGNESCDQVGYSLRGNPKKASKFAKPSEEDTLLANKLCKECGKSFHSWKALFGHMKCHSEKVLNSTVEEEDSLCSANQKVVTDYNQSDNEEAADPNRKKRSRRRIKRYMAAKTASSSSLTVANTSPPSVSDAEKEQNEVAMCLILLSRDVGNWGGLNSVGESSGNSSEFLEIRLSHQADQITKGKGKSEKCNGSGRMKLNKLKNGKIDTAILDSEKTNSELKASRIARNGSKMKKLGVQTDGILQDGKLSNTEMNNGDGFEGSEVEFSRNLIVESGIDQTESDTKKKTTRKRKRTDQHGPELSMDYSKKVDAKNGKFDIELYDAYEKKSKFQCTACNKTFHSYQALGGHRASHKKLKGCIASNIDSSENSTETDQSPNQTADSKLIKFGSYDDNIVYHESNKGGKEHECPICFRIFPSGQALGGHKRSHLIGEAKTIKNVVIQKSIPPQVRDFLDLNLPPPVEEETSEQVGSFQPWWIRSNHQHEQLVGLVSD